MTGVSKTRNYDYAGETHVYGNYVGSVEFWDSVEWSVTVGMDEINLLRSLLSSLFGGIYAEKSVNEARSE
jgi:hypothetical protein